MSVTEQPSVNQGSGWYEFFHPIKATTHIAHLFENGDMYLPEEGVTYEDFVFAAARHMVFRLIREEDTVAHPLGMDGKAQ